MTELEPQFMDGLEISGFELNRSFDGLQEGVWEPGDLKVTPGAGVSVSVAAGRAYVLSDWPSAAGELYRIRNDAAKGSGAFAGGGISPNASGNPRLDQIIARIYDHTFDGLGLRVWRLEVLQGNPTAGATLDNRNGAAALPNTALRLADVLVANGAGSIPSGNIRDRRPWARGAFYFNSDTSGDINLTGGLVAYGSAPRLEIGSGTVFARLGGSFSGSGSATRGVVNINVDGGNFLAINLETAVIPGRHSGFDFTIGIASLTPGSHTFQGAFAEITADVVLRRAVGVPYQLMIWEDLRNGGSNS